MEKVTCFGTDKVKDTWDYCNNNLSFDDEKDSYGICWPPRHYTCSFCRRNFKSAQALGGHMNVHRRDRAMLRQPPSWVVQYSSPNPNPSPNLEFKYSSSSSSLSPSATLPPPCSNYKLNSLMMMSPSLTSLSSASSSSASIYDERKVMVMGPPRKPSSSHRRREKKKQSSMRTLSSTVELEDFNQEEDEYKVMMNNGQIARSLDLEIGLIRNKKENLDLELRLGYS